MKEMTSPPTPHPKQCQSPRVGVTWNDGDFSSWNGHSPFRLPPPARLSCRCSPTISSIFERSRTSAMSAARIRPRGGHQLVRRRPRRWRHRRRGRVAAGCSTQLQPQQEHLLVQRQGVVRPSASAGATSRRSSRSRRPARRRSTYRWVPRHIEAFCISHEPALEVDRPGAPPERLLAGTQARACPPARRPTAPVSSPLRFANDPHAVADDGRGRLLPVRGAQHRDDRPVAEHGQLAPSGSRPTRTFRVPASDPPQPMPGRAGDAVAGRAVEQVRRSLAEDVRNCVVRVSTAGPCRVGELVASMPESSAIRWARIACHGSVTRTALCQPCVAERRGHRPHALQGVHALGDGEQRLRAGRRPGPGSRARLGLGELVTGRLAAHGDDHRGHAGLVELVGVLEPGREDRRRDAVVLGRARAPRSRRTSAASPAARSTRSPAPWR